MPGPVKRQHTAQALGLARLLRAAGGSMRYDTAMLHSNRGVPWCSTCLPADLIGLSYTNSNGSCNA